MLQCHHTQRHVFFDELRMEWSFYSRRLHSFGILDPDACLFDALADLLGHVRILGLSFVEDSD